MKPLPIKRILDAIVYVLWGPESHARNRYNAQRYGTWWF